jgi:hypothetical protein
VEFAVCKHTNLSVYLIYYTNQMHVISYIWTLNT